MIAINSNNESIYAMTCVIRFHTGIICCVGLAMQVCGRNWNGIMNNLLATQRSAYISLADHHIAVDTHVAD